MSTEVPPTTDHRPAPKATDRVPSCSRRRRRAVLVLIASIVVALLTLGLAPRAGDEADAGADDAVPGTVVPDLLVEDGDIDIVVEGTQPPGFAVGEEAGLGLDSLDPIDIADPWPGPSGGSGGGWSGSVDPTPQPEPQPDDDGVDEPPSEEPDDQTPEEPVDPCAALEPGAHLVTTPDPKHLNPGALSSSLTIRNCGADPVDWTAATTPSVSLDDDAGTLPAGETHQLGFTIEGAAFDGTDIAFKIKVSEPGFNQYVDISATKAGLADPGNVPPDPGGTLSTGGPTGCAASCIIKALLAPNATTPNMALDVATSMPAQIAVFVSTSAPVDGPEGEPTFPEGGLIAATDDFYEVWSTSLSPLVAATDYHIVVRATDVDGGVEHRVGTFRTTTPAVDPDLDEQSTGDPVGCFVQCITKAWLTPDPASFDMGLEVTTHTLARLEAYLSTEAPTVDEDGVPSFPGAEPVATNNAYETSWTTTLGPLEPATRYHVIVKATDGEFRSSYQAGSFETREGADQLLVSFHEIRVHNDGDAGGNPGELHFTFAVDDEHLAKTGEYKVDSGTTVHLSDGDRWPGLSTVVDFDPSPSAFLPPLSAVALERDDDGVYHSCQIGDGQSDQGHSDDCDLKWDVAMSGLIQSGALSSLPSCADLGIDAVEVADHRCIELESVGNGDDYPRFTAIVSVQPVEP